MKTQISNNTGRSRGHVLSGKVSSGDSDSSSPGEESLYQHYLMGCKKYLNKSTWSNKCSNFDDISEQHAFQFEQASSHNPEVQEDQMEVDEQQETVIPLDHASSQLKTPFSKFQDRGINQSEFPLEGSNFVGNIPENRKMLTVQLHGKDGKLVFKSSCIVDTTKKSIFQLNLGEGSMVEFKSL
ncbi:unnamed protein product [Moneuplotes crassus]|uniref:Uncharacterized protein n=1 Tax=Euplotes crassus TaxID=5936 RepID=A0AAD1Y1D4_EUPCR|nr:unnamed protein product [Moneuplotes crassus]